MKNEEKIEAKREEIRLKRQQFFDRNPEAQALNVLNS